MLDFAQTVGTSTNDPPLPDVEDMSPVVSSMSLEDNVQDEVGDQGLPLEGFELDIESRKEGDEIEEKDFQCWTETSPWMKDVTMNKAQTTKGLGAPTIDWAKMAKEFATQESTLKDEDEENSEQMLGASRIDWSALAKHFKTQNISLSFEDDDSDDELVPRKHQGRAMYMENDFDSDETYERSEEEYDSEETYMGSE